MAIFNSELLNYQRVQLLYMLLYASEDVYTFNESFFYNGITLQRWGFGGLQQGQHADTEWDGSVKNLRII